MTGKRNPVHGISVYRRGRKWSYRLELERNPLTGARQFEYVHGYGSDDEAWSAAASSSSSISPTRRSCLMETGLNFGIRHSFPASVRFGAGELA
jgi:hypothetical protein